MEYVTTAGALVTITKNVIDAIKGARSFWSNKPKEDAKLEQIEEAFKVFQARLSYLANQLTQSEALYRMLPMWRNNLAQIPVWQSALADDDVPKLDQRLRQLISDSIHDNFSAIFFEQQFDTLPDVPKKIEQFRERLQDLERELQAIPYSNQEAWKNHWPTLKMRLGDLDRLAWNLERHVTDLRGSLVREIESAAAAG